MSTASFDHKALEIARRIRDETADLPNDTRILAHTQVLVREAMEFAAAKPLAEPVPGICMLCGCTEEDCRQCIEATGAPCIWANEQRTLCSACVFIAFKFLEGVTAR